MTEEIWREAILPRTSSAYKVPDEFERAIKAAQRDALECVVDKVADKFLEHSHGTIQKDKPSALEINSVILE